jgi:hypothetical protein
VAGTGTESCPMASFAITSVGYLGCATRRLVIHDNANSIT